VADRRRHDRRDERRQAHIDRVSGASDPAAGEQRRARRRDEAARSAAAGPSAARWLVAEPDAPLGAGGRPLDVVADLLALDPRTRLRGRGDAELRALAGGVERLVGIGATTPSGRTLLEVLVADPEARAALSPSLDLEALLADAPVSDRSHDRTIRVAEAMLARADEHRRGVVDLHALVAPVGLERHPAADELETIVHVATEHVTIPANAAPAVATTSDGWIGASPVELFLTAARGLLDGTAAAVGGAALYAWLDGVTRDAGDPWWLTLTGILEVDVPELLQPAAARAGSDHPDVAGAVLTELVALRHPLL
jgi:hypothetical protein